MNESRTTVQSASSVPIPRTVSDAARAILGTPSPAARMDLPHHSDLDAWRFLVEAVRSQTDEATITALACATTGAVPGPVDVACFDREVDGSVYYDASPVDVAPDDDRVLLVIHGGSFVHGGGAIARRGAELLASYLSMRVWAADYRMPPDSPFPAGLDDVVTLYRHLVGVQRPSSVVVSGTSAGGNLAAALMHRANEMGLPVPAGLILHTPIVDLEMAGDTWETLSGLSEGLDNAIEMSHVYAGAENFRNPLASPLHGDVAFFPPTLLISGTRDPVLSDTVRMHRKLLTAGVPAELILTEGEPHGGYFSRAPEDVDRMQIVQGFIERRLSASN